MKLEILAPAGNAACAKAAIDSGANAIYLGYSAFSARQSAENFTLESLSDIIKYAHFCGACVYVAMNTIVKDDETEEFLRTLLRVWSVGADAIILQDVLLGKTIKRRYPQIELHLSTQAGVCTANGAEFAKECGFSRVIIARETPISEIEKISKIIETECFVQGALCTCFSGQCYFSSFAGGNSGNRGRCKQPCRKLYSYDRNGNAEKSYALSLSDLCVGEDVEKLIAAGVTSFKIEGRMRRAEYVAAATQYYRNIIDGATQQKQTSALSALKRTYNRGNYTKGLAFGQDKRLLSTSVQGHLGEKVGVVKVVNGNYFVESSFRAQSGDAFKILRGGMEVGGAVYAKTQGRGFCISSAQRLKNGDGVFVTTDTALNARLLDKKTRRTLALSLRFHENECPSVSCDTVKWTGNERLESASSRPLTVEELKVCFSKTDGLPVDVVFEKVDLSGNIFIPKSKLNALRRNFYETFSQTVTKRGNEDYEYSVDEIVLPSGNCQKTAVIAEDFSDLETDIAVYKPKDFLAPLPSSFIYGDFEKYIYYPAYVTSDDERAMESYLSQAKIDGVYVENYGGLMFAQKHHLQVFGGTGLNITNRISLKELCARAKYVALSKELSESELSLLRTDNTFVLSSGNVKLMDLCYCPFGKTCGKCDKKDVYTLTDEHGRAFPVRRYRVSDTSCRFEVYNCAELISTGIDGYGYLLDLSVTQDKARALAAKGNIEEQKSLYKNYTSGHYKRGVL